MAKFEVLKRFKGIEEGKTFEPGQEIDMTVKRAEEVQSNINEKFPGYGEVLKRVKEVE